MKREIQIIKMLIEKESYITIDELSYHFDVSTRTIRNDIEKIERFLHQYNVLIQKDRKKGVAIFVEEEEARKIEKILSKLEPYSKNQRLKSVMKEIIKGATTINQLIEITECSRTTIQNDLRNCSVFVSDAGGTLKRKAHYGISLEANEIAYRLILCEYIIQFTDFNIIYQKMDDLSKFMNSVDDIVINVLKDSNIIFVQNYLNKYEKDFLVKFTDESRIKILLYICVTMNRIKNKHQLTEEDVFEVSINERTLQWIKQNSTIFNLGTNMVLHLPEEIALSSQFSSAKMLSVDEIDNNEALDYAERFLDIARISLNAPFQIDSKLKSNLALHIKSAVYRMQNNIKIKNPIKDDILAVYPYLVTAARAGANEIAKQFSTKFDEEEISLFALYLANIIEDKKVQNNIHFIKAIIVCPDGYATSGILYSKMQKYFPNIIIESVLSVREFNKYDVNDIDLVITTTQIYMKISVDMILVNPLLLEDDVDKIRSYLSKSEARSNFTNTMLNELMTIILQNCVVNDYNNLTYQLYRYFKKNETLRKRDPSLKDIVTEQNILLHYHAESWQDAVIAAGDLLYQNGSVKRDYSTKMVEKVKEIGPYIVILPGIALPHAGYEDGGMKTDMSFVTLNNPVIFGREEYDPVRLVIALAVSEKFDHIDALSELTELLQNRQNYEALIESNEKEDFLNHLLSHKKEKGETK